MKKFPGLLLLYVFTTKPTGQGTGLGLSMSYDIIKAHGGEIKVETREGERSEFIIKLPIF
jgi:two-component system, NtrC family, sensor kinase